MINHFDKGFKVITEADPVRRYPGAANWPAAAALVYVMKIKT